MELSAVEIAAAVRGGERTAVEVLDEALAAIAAGNDALAAFVHVDEGLARAAAEAVDAAVAAGRDPGPFAGVPIGVKDLEDCAGMPTGYGSLPFAGRGPATADSVHVARLRAAGAVPVGKTAAPSSAPQLHQDQGGRAGPQPVGPRHDPRRVERGQRRRWPPAWSRPPRPATGAARPGSRPPSAGWWVQAELRAHPLHRCHRVRDIGEGPAHHHRRRQRPPPGRHRGPRRPRPLLAAPTAGVLRVGRRAAPGRGLRARWSPDLGTFLCDPEVRQAAEAAAPSWPGPPAWSSTTSRCP